MIILETFRYEIYFLVIAFWGVQLLGMHRKLNHYVKRDIFTGLYNKVFFSHTIQKWINRERSFYFFILDIDNFKSINDTYGHAVGDEIILHMSRSLKQILPNETMISRFGGDEFVFALRNTKEEKFATWLDQLQNLEYKTIDGELIKFTVSIGVSESTNHTEYKKLYHKADENLYMSKKLGKGRYTLNTVLAN